MDLSEYDLSGLGNQAHGHYKAAEKHKAKAEEQYMAAGLYLKEAKMRCLKERGQTFARFLKEHCPIGKSRAYEVIAIADGTKTVEEVRERSTKAQQATRARRADEASVRDVADKQPEKPNENNESPSETVEDQSFFDVVEEVESVNQEQMSELRKKVERKINFASYEQLLKIMEMLK